MLFPTQPYTRQRIDENQISLPSSWGYTTTSFDGTPTDPWHISGTSNFSDSAGMQRLNREMWDVLTPQWRKRSALGEIINNPMEYTYTLEKSSVVPYYYSGINRYGPPYHYHGSRINGTSIVGGNLEVIPSQYTWSLPTIPYIDDGCISAAITEAWSKVSINEAQLLVQMTEFQKTVESLVSILWRAIKIFRELKNLDLKALRKEISAHELKQRYMEVRYALRPMMYDAIGILKVYDRSLEINDRYTFRSYKAYSTDSGADNVVLLDDPALVFRLSGSQDATRTIECRAGVLAYIDWHVKALLALGVAEPAQAAWELLPFSFVADWFCNVGKLLASWSPKFGIKILASWYTVTDICVLTSTVVTGENKVSFNYESIYSRTGSYSKTIVKKYRLPNPDRPLLPSFDTHINWWKTLDLGIIIEQLFRMFK